MDWRMRNSSAKELFLEGYHHSRKALPEKWFGVVTFIPGTQIPWDPNLRRDDTGQPFFNEEQANLAVEAGCPEKLVSKAREDFSQLLEKWEKIREEYDIHGRIVEAAKKILAEKGGGAVVVYHSQPEATQWLSDECLAAFNKGWQNFVEKIGDPDGSLDIFSWKWVETLPAGVEAESGYSYMRYRFHARKIGSKIFLGKLTCGESSPHDDEY